MENEGCHAVIFFSVSLCTRIYMYVLCAGGVGEDGAGKDYGGRYSGPILCTPIFLPLWEDWTGMDPFLCIYVYMWTGFMWPSSG